MFELQVIHWSHFILPVQSISWIYESEKGIRMHRFLFLMFNVCPCIFKCVRLTRQGAAKHLQPHTQCAVPALRDDSDVAGHHRHCQLVHHWSVLITVSKEQLDRHERGWEEEKYEREEEGDII